MALAYQKTLGELRDDLARRLGFGAQVGHLGDMDETLKSFLESAQEELWRQFDWPRLRTTHTRDTGIEQEFYDYPDDCDPDRIYQVDVQYEQFWHKLEEGISHRHDSFKDYHWYPIRYERRQQLEVWPLPKGNYPLRIEYLAKPARFRDDKDRCTIDSHLVFLQALVIAKRHYGQPDADRVENQMKAHLGKLRASEHGNERYIVNQVIQESEDDYWPRRPIVVEGD